MGLDNNIWIIQKHVFFKGNEDPTASLNLSDVDSQQKEEQVKAWSTSSPYAKLTHVKMSSFTFILIPLFYLLSNCYIENSLLQIRKYSTRQDIL